MTTLCFVAMHYTEFVHYWPAALGLLALSVVTLVLRIRTGSIAAPVAVHFGYNLVLVCVVVLTT